MAARRTATEVDALALHRAADTLWIFDADFEDFSGCNEGTDDLADPGDSATGWYTYDHTPFPQQSPQWHLDAFRAYPDGQLPDSSYWCGRHDTCWSQAGYGNLWRQYLWRELDLTPYAGSAVQLLFRQQFALEKDYDFGYVDAAVVVDSVVGPFQTIYSVTNTGFGSPGSPQEWDSPFTGEVSLSLDAFAGERIMLRWRLQTDRNLSSEDTAASSPSGPAVADGGWYIDEVRVVCASDTVFHADFENRASPDNQGWHAEAQGGGQIGQYWRRELVDDWGAERDAVWALVATHPMTGGLLLDQRARVVSPVVGLPSCDQILIAVDGYFEPSDFDVYYSSVYVSTGADAGCLGRPATMELVGSVTASQPGPIHWSVPVVLDPLDDHAAIVLEQECNYEPTGRGLFVDRVRIGALDATPTAVSPHEMTSSVSLAATPSPSGSSISLQITAAPNASAELRIFSVSGREVLCRTISCDDTGAGVLLWPQCVNERDTVAAGVYFARATTRGHHAASKFVWLP